MKQRFEAGNVQTTLEYMKPQQEAPACRISAVQNTFTLREIETPVTSQSRVSIVTMELRF